MHSASARVHRCMPPRVATVAAAPSASSHRATSAKPLPTVGANCSAKLPMPTQPATSSPQAQARASVRRSSGAPAVSFIGLPRARAPPAMCSAWPVLAAKRSQVLGRIDVDAVAPVVGVEPAHALGMRCRATCGRRGRRSPASHWSRSARVEDHRVARFADRRPRLRTRGTTIAASPRFLNAPISAMMSCASINGWSAERDDHRVEPAATAPAARCAPTRPGRRRATGCAPA